jgi:DNA-binding GntR family transcriptional regulator
MNKLFVGAGLMLFLASCSNANSKKWLSYSDPASGDCVLSFDYPEGDTVCMIENARYIAHSPAGTDEVVMRTAPWAVIMEAEDTDTNADLTFYAQRLGVPVLQKQDVISVAGVEAKRTSFSEEGSGTPVLLVVIHFRKCGTLFTVEDKRPDEGTFEEFLNSIRIVVKEKS